MMKLFKEMKLFKGGNYMRKYGIYNVIFTLFICMCPTFHYYCPVLFTFNCCSKYSGINVKLIYNVFTVTSTSDCTWQIFANVHFFHVSSFHCNFTVYICSVTQTK